MTETEDTAEVARDLQAAQPMRSRPCKLARVRRSVAKIQVEVGRALGRSQGAEPQALWGVR